MKDRLGESNRVRIEEEYIDVVAHLATANAASKESWGAVMEGAGRIMVVLGWSESELRRLRIVARGGE
jgi:hypothetical protein